MNPTLLRRSPAGGKPLIRQEAVEAAWGDFRKTRERAMRSAQVEDGIAAGRARGAFLRHFERM